MFILSFYNGQGRDHFVPCRFRNSSGVLSGQVSEIQRPIRARSFSPCAGQPPPGNGLDIFFFSSWGCSSWAAKKRVRPLPIPMGFRTKISKPYITTRNPRVYTWQALQIRRYEIVSSTVSITNRSYPIYNCFNKTLINIINKK